MWAETPAGACVECQPGSRGNLSSQLWPQACVPCKPGRFADKSGASECRECAIGRSASKSGAKGCEACPAGKFATEAGEAHCAWCPQRFDVTLNVCRRPCEPGSVWTPASTSAASEEGLPGQALNASHVVPPKPGVPDYAGTCMRCPAGTRSNASTSAWPTSCVECPLGSFAALSGASACSLCPAGKYAGSPRTSACDKCPKGKAPARESGSPNCADCNWAYIGSADCSIPWIGLLLVATVLCLIVSIVSHVYRRWRSLHRDLQAKTHTLKARLEDMELMSRAWQLQWDEVEITKEIARVAFGVVWHGSLHGKWEVAVKKILHSEAINLKDDKEIKFLKRARHQRLVMFIGCGNCDDGNIFVVLEYMDRGSLDSILWGKRSIESSASVELRSPPPVRGSRRGPSDGRSAGGGPRRKILPWELRLRLLQDIADGMAYLHLNCDSVHRDLKTPNVLLSMESHKLRAKIADFGMSRFMGPSTPKPRTGAKSKRHLIRKKEKKGSKYFGRSNTTKPKRKKTSLAEKGRAWSIGVPSLPSQGSAAANASPRPPAHSLQRRSLTESWKSQSSNESHRVATMTTGRGTPLWMAPEIIATLKMPGQSLFTQAVDTYAFGIIMWEALCREEPWSTSGFKFSHEILDAVEKGDRPPVTLQQSRDAPPGYEALMAACWHEDPDERPRFNWIIQMLGEVQVEFHQQARDRLKNARLKRELARDTAPPMFSVASTRDAHDIKASRVDVMLEMSRVGSNERGMARSPAPPLAPTPMRPMRPRRPPQRTPVPARKPPTAAARRPPPPRAKPAATNNPTRADDGAQAPPMFSHESI